MANVKKDLPTKISEGRSVLLNRMIRDLKAYEHLKILDPFDQDLIAKRNNLLDLIKKQLSLVRSMRELEQIELDIKARQESTLPASRTESTAEVTYLTEARELLKRNKISG